MRTQVPPPPTEDPLTEILGSVCFLCLLAIAVLSMLAM